MRQVYQRVRKYKGQTEPKNYITDKNILEVSNNILDNTEEQVINLKVKQIEITQAKQKPKQKSICFNEGSLRDLCENSKCMNICIIGIPKGEREKKREENYLKK